MTRGQWWTWPHGDSCGERRDGSALAALDAEASALHSAGRVHLRTVSRQAVSGSVYSDDGSHNASFKLSSSPRRSLPLWTCSCGSDAWCIGKHVMSRLTTTPLTVFEVAA